MLNNLFVCDGTVLYFEYFRGTPEGKAFIGIWRHLSEDVLLLKRRVEVPEAAVGIHRVYFDRPLPVHKGDILGVHYPSDAPTGVITSSMPQDGVLPPEEFYHTLVVEVRDEELSPGAELNISRRPWHLERKTFALGAWMHVASAYPSTEGLFTNASCMRILTPLLVVMHLHDLVPSMQTAVR